MAAIPSGSITLRNAHGMKVAISDLGATLVSWHTPDRAGRLGDILLGHDTPAEYVAATTYMGGLIGRWANRIADARFTLDGIEYTLDRNEGTNLLHGGTVGFHRALWDVQRGQRRIADASGVARGRRGFSGQRDHASALFARRRRHADHRVRSMADAPTPVNLTNHGYFNLTGRPGTRHSRPRDVDRRGAFFEVDARDDSLRACRRSGQCVRLPAGRADRRAARLAACATRARGRLRSLLRAARASRGGATKVRGRWPVAVYDPGSGRELTVSTDQRGMQFYTGNFLNGIVGRGGVRYHKHAGLCLETGAFPNQVNMAVRAEVIVAARR